MQITEIDKNDMGFFNNSISKEKMLLICMEDCASCDQLSEIFHDMQQEKTLEKINLFKMKLLKDADGLEEFMKAVNVKFFPTLFYFKNGEFIARKQGAFSGKQPKKKLHSWIKNRRKS